ncbi:MAG: hypothetical protein KDD99_04905, partial [Bacteroidetes bacterium]|nr:hypothetical protein [Bacteroidota bacterium]
MNPFSVFNKSLSSALTGVVLVLIMLTHNLYGQMGPRKMEYLTRGLVAVNDGNHVFLSWRIMATDTSGVEFNLYRDGTLINSSPITGISNYIDSSGTSESLYYL